MRQYIDWLYIQMLECFEYGTRAEYIQAEREYWDELKSLGIVEGEWRSR